MKRAIVTGASGFIGRWLVQKLVERDVEVIALVRSLDSRPFGWTEDKVRTIQCDISQYPMLEKRLAEIEGADTFYHLAWQGVGGRSRADYTLQLNNMKYACDAAVLAGKAGCRRYIGVGTITENFARNIFSLSSVADNLVYGVCKDSLHTLLKVICEREGIELVWARLSNIYGPYNRTGNIISYMLAELMEGRVPEFSSGNQIYDLMYVEDAAAAMVAMGLADNVEDLYFIGSGEPRLLKDYLTEIADIYGKGSSIGLGRKREDGLVYKEEWFDISPLKMQIGFAPSITLKEGIKRTIRWLEEENE